MPTSEMKEMRKKMMMRKQKKTRTTKQKEEAKNDDDGDVVVLVAAAEAEPRSRRASPTLPGGSRATEGTGGRWRGKGPRGPTRR